VSETSTQRRSAEGRLGTIGGACAGRPLTVIALWLVLLVASVVANGLAGGIFNDNVSLSGTQAYTGLKLLDANEPSAGGYAGQVVFHVSSGSLRSHETAIAATVSNLEHLPHVLSASDPLAKGSTAISSDGSTAYSTVHFDVRTKTLGHDYVAQLEGATAPARADGIQVEYGGGLDELFRPSPNDRLSEVIGIAVAIAVLLIGFGSVAGAIVPLASAIIAVLTGVSLLGLGAALVTFGTTAPTLALMIGLGVGIDYALFLGTRFRQLIADGWEPVEAAGRTVATSGRAVLIAACTVALALLGLYASGISFIGQLGLAAIFTVVTAALAALTLVPAILGLIGRRIDAVSVRTPVAEAGSEGDGWHRYADLVARRPWRFLICGTAVLLILALPLLSIELGHIDDGADSKSYTDRRAYDLIASGFGKGANGTFTIVVDMHGANKPASEIAKDLETAVARLPDVAHSTPLKASGNGAILYGSVIPGSSPQADSTKQLFDEMVHTTLPDALADTGAKGYVAGLTATQLQFRDTLTERLPVVIAVVVALAFLLLMASFRSVLVALKAAVLNLLSIGAAYGVIVAVFQWGWGRGLVGVSERVPIESYVPVLMFAIVFGLSMDYEVFLLSRVREAWLGSGENTAAVASGLSSTARVITCAALIMASVFISFVLSSSVTVKMLAVGLSISVLVDATVVRLVMVPATMTLLGDANWWLPRWLDRLLPRLEPEAEPAGGRSEEPSAEGPPVPLARESEA
jgi:putative drug exporter of the RND superfamily